MKKLDQTLVNAVFLALIATSHAALAQPTAPVDTKTPNSNPTVTPTGQKIPLNDFKKIRIQGAIEVVLVQGVDNFVMFENKDIEAKKGEVKIESRDGTLQIGSSDNWKLRREGVVKLTVGFKNIDDIRLQGSGNLMGTGPLKFDDVRLSIAGSGDIDLKEVQVSSELKASIGGSGNIKLAGTATSLNVSVAGSGDFAGEVFKADTVKVAIAGSGDVKVWSNKEISLSIAGSGNVDHWGPGKVVKQSIAGVGSVTPKGGR